MKFTSETGRSRGLSAGMETAGAGAVEGRFGRMFDLPSGAPLPLDCLRAIAQAMVKDDLGAPITESEPVDENPAITAGYTYFGQFIDHDITFDPTPLNAATTDKTARLDFRSPALDLDSVYGRGPADQPYLYDYPFLRVGQPLDSGSAPHGTRHDMFRVPGTAQGPLERPNIPLLGDKRNDENKIISQMHGVIITLHNRIASAPDIIRANGGDPCDPDSVFDTAARLTRHHYQWVVVYDYLDRICEQGTVAEYLDPDSNALRLPNYLKPDQAFAYMPVEFAVAAFRFGHSMIRPSYALNRFTGTDASTKRIPLFSRQPSAQNLNGFPGTVPDTWGIDWGYFLDGLAPVVPQPTVDEPNPPKFQVPQPSYRIDALLAQPLADLPEFRKAADMWVHHLAYRNLVRGQGLPSGEDVSKFLMNGTVTLAEDVIWAAGSTRLGSVPMPGDTPAEQAAAQNDMDQTTRARVAVWDAWAKGNGVLKGNTPLWYYILREAEYYGVTRCQQDPGIAFGGQHLGPVGSKIVAETLIGLLAMDRGSFINQETPFKPCPEIMGGDTLTLTRLVAFATTPP